MSLDADDLRFLARLARGHEFGHAVSETLSQAVHKPEGRIAQHRLEGRLRRGENLQGMSRFSH